MSVGADGIILLDKGNRAPLRMRYLNSDGKVAAMCGNGARCAAYYARSKGIIKRDSFHLETTTGILRMRVQGRGVAMVMGRPGPLKNGLGVVRENDLTEGGYIDTGVPHLVLFHTDVEHLPVDTIAPYYRHHARFPTGINVNFVQIIDSRRIRVRTYERGVEGETLSCGTGAVASALIASRFYRMRSPVRVVSTGGVLTVTFDQTWKEVELAGNVTPVFEGSLSECLELLPGPD
jgi:diaminopimelate epimerase